MNNYILNIQTVVTVSKFLCVFRYEHSSGTAQAIGKAYNSKEDKKYRIQKNILKRQD